MLHMIQKCSIWLVLREFLADPVKKWHIRELSRKVKLASTSVKLHLKKLVREGLLFERDDDVFKYYIANFDSEKFRFYKIIDWRLRIQESGLAEYLNDRCSPDTIILFGSCAKGEDLKEGDIDIYLQCSKKELDLGKYEKLLGRKIQLFFSERLNKLPKELRNNILNGIKLDGYIKVF